MTFTPSATSSFSAEQSSGNGVERVVKLTNCSSWCPFIIPRQRCPTAFLSGCAATRY